jgi:hypothetical protein
MGWTGFGPCSSPPPVQHQTKEMRSAGPLSSQAGRPRLCSLLHAGGSGEAAFVLALRPRAAGKQTGMPGGGERSGWRGALGLVGWAGWT